LLDEIRKARLVAPAELLTRLSGIAEQDVDLSRTEIPRIDLDEDLSGLGVDPGLLDACASPGDPAAHMAEGELDEFAHGMLLACGQHIVVRLVLLEHHPHAFHVVAGMAPIPLGVEIAEIDPVLEAELDGGDSAGDLAGDEGFATSRPFVVEQDAVGG